jgi:hypothetical protein
MKDLRLLLSLEVRRAQFGEVVEVGRVVSKLRDCSQYIIRSHLVFQPIGPTRNSIAKQQSAWE